VQHLLIHGSELTHAKLDRSVTGACSLDLTETGKGRMLEPVRISYGKDRKSVIIEQYLRKLATPVPILGATVDFDQRFATAVKCGAFNQE
jgi:hypothetical protein